MTKGFFSHGFKKWEHVKKDLRLKRPKIQEQLSLSKMGLVLIKKKYLKTRKKTLLIESRSPSGLLSSVMKIFFLSAILYLPPFLQKLHIKSMRYCEICEQQIWISRNRHFNLFSFFCVWKRGPPNCINGSGYQLILLIFIITLIITFCWFSKRRLCILHAKIGAKLRPWVC